MRARGSGVHMYVYTRVWSIIMLNKCLVDQTYYALSLLPPIASVLVQVDKALLIKYPYECVSIDTLGYKDPVSK